MLGLCLAFPEAGEAESEAEVGAGAPVAAPAANDSSLVLLTDSINLRVCLEIPFLCRTNEERKGWRYECTNRIISARGQRLYFPQPE